MLYTVTIVVIAVLTILFALIYRFAYAPYGALKKMGVNGPVPRAFWGNVSSFVKDRIGMMDDLQRTYGDVSGFYIGAVPVLLVTDLELLKLITVKNFDAFTDHIMFSDSKQLFGLEPNLLELRGEYWRSSRHAISPTFTGNKMKQMVSIVQQSVDKIVKQLGSASQSGQSIEVWRAFGAFTMQSILAVAFGRQVNLHSGDENEDQVLISAKTIFEFQKTGTAIVDPFTVLAVTSHFPFLNYFSSWVVPKEMTKCGKCLTDTAEALIEARKLEGGSVKHNDFLQLLLDLERTDGTDSETKGKRAILTSKEIKTHCFTFLLAGYETTANCLSFTSYLLATNPEVQDKLCEEIDSYFKTHAIATGMYEATQDIEYLDMVIQESLRLYPPAYVTSRVCTQDVEIGEFNIPCGTVVFIPIMNIHHDKRIWESPENFRPERFSPEEKEQRPQLCHIPFGWGPRNCIGMRFALMEAKLLLIAILLKYRFVVGPETEIPLKVTTGITLSPSNGIQLKIESRN